ncbi:MAG TPA: DUF3857 domain-containing protein, partial [Sphingomicrobium sp.]|nr:DUF3857 domain-containing protein [Sphingomicrobium sp.]
MNRLFLAMAIGPQAVAAQASTIPSAREVKYDASPAWVVPPPTAKVEANSSDAAFRIIYQDMQERITPGRIESYTAYRVKILKPEALPMGNVALLWSPSGGSAEVHYVRIIRDKQTIDVLKQAKFKVLEREAGLEQSILDGNLTASLQVPGLQVGDELEFAATVIHSEPAFGDHAAGAAQLPVNGFPGTYRYRLAWPEAKSLSWR